MDNRFFVSISSKISRRTLMKNGAKGLISVGMVPFFLRESLGKAFAVTERSRTDVNDYYNRFGVDKKIIMDVMSEALSHGGDYADIYFQHKITDSLGLEDKAVNRAYSNVDFGVGIRVLKGDQTGYCFTEEITPKAMKLAAQTAANIADSNKNVNPVQLSSHSPAGYYAAEMPWEKVSIDKKIPYLQKINDRVFELDSRIIKAQVFLRNITSYILIATSDGRITYDYQPMVSMFVDSTAEQNSRREKNYFGLSQRSGMEFLTDENAELMATECVKRTVALLDAVKLDSGEMPVVLAPGSSGILLHEAIGHGMEADFNRKNISIFSDKIGKPVCEKFVTIIDDGTNKNLRGSVNIDDEANDTEKTFLVKDGILRSYLHDRISAKHYNVKPTGNGRRESFRHTPMPRMRNTYMLPGPHKREEIIQSVKKGLYAEVFSNGQVNIGAGDFTFYVKSGHLIENGKLTRPVKDVNIIGNGPDVLKKIVMLADDFKMTYHGGTCGKNGQRAPVSYGLPTVKVSAITVGGQS